MTSDKPPALLISRFLALDVLEQVDSDFAQELSKDQLSSNISCSCLVFNLICRDRICMNEEFSPLELCTR